MIDAPHLQALRKLHGCLVAVDAAWAVTGSLGMALQGMDLPVHDIDIQSSESGVHEIEHCLAAFVVEPIHLRESADMRSHFGRLWLEDVDVEIMGPIQWRLPRGAWGPPVEIEPIRRWAALENLAIPVLSLEYEYWAYLRMGRLERAEKIRQWLDREARR